MSLGEKVLRGVLRSLGVKRKLSALITLLAGIGAGVPELAGLVAVLQAFNAWLAGASLVHAGIGKTLAQVGLKSLSVSALIQLLIGVISAKIPEAAHFIPLLQTLSVVLSAFGLGGVFKKN